MRKCLQAQQFKKHVINLLFFLYFCLNYFRLFEYSALTLLESTWAEQARLAQQAN